MGDEELFLEDMNFTRAKEEEILTGLKASSTRTGLAGRATGGPTCPVERPARATSPVSS